MVKKWRLWQEYATDNHCKQLLHQFENGMYVSFGNHNQLTEGQFVAWYMEDELVGSGVIS
jgi:tRNA-specific 2-thiouridylase